MASAKVMGNWAERRYREARDTLLATGHIREVVPASRRRAAEYTLVARVLAPSIAARGAP